MNALFLKSILTTDVVTCGIEEVLGRAAPRVAQCAEPAGGTASQAGT